MTNAATHSMLYAFVDFSAATVALFSHDNAVI